MRYLGNGQARSPEQVEDFHRRRVASAALVPGLGFWAGFVKDDFVGWWLLEPPARDDQGPVTGQAELGYRLLRRYWRQGLASEGARELIRHGFEDLNLARIFAETMAVNAASRATMAAVGMQHVRTFHLAFDEPLPGAEQARLSTRSAGPHGSPTRSEDRVAGPIAERLVGPRTGLEGRSATGWEQHREAACRTGPVRGRERARW